MHYITLERLSVTACNRPTGAASLSTVTSCQEPVIGHNWFLKLCLYHLCPLNGNKLWRSANQAHGRSGNSEDELWVRCSHPLGCCHVPKEQVMKINFSFLVNAGASRLPSQTSEEQAKRGPWKDYEKSFLLWLCCEGRAWVNQQPPAHHTIGSSSWLSCGWTPTD